jgi:hypothetical protein
MREQQVEEIAVSQLSLRELIEGSHRLDGMKACLGCEDVFVLAGYCASCARINEELERRRCSIRRVNQVDMGVVPFDALEPQAVPPPHAIGLIVAGGLALSILVLTGAWVCLRELTSLVLRHS